MIPRRDELPEDAADWRASRIRVDRSANDSTDACPVGDADLLEYLRAESGDGGDADPGRLRFLRTGRFPDARAWLWHYVESDGTVCFVTVFHWTDGRTFVALTEPRGLDPDQYLLAAYYDEVYWS